MTEHYFIIVQFIFTLSVIEKSIGKEKCHQIKINNIVKAIHSGHSWIGLIHKGYQQK